MLMFKKTGLFVYSFYCLLFFTGCQKSDEKKLIGKWQSDRDWFEYKADQTYASGKDDIKMVDHFHYTIDPARKELNLYTDDPHPTYYLIYNFKSDDTLEVRNAMSTNKKMVSFYKVKSRH